MSFRKSWDKEKYEERAKLRAEGKLIEDDDNTSNNHKRIIEPGDDSYLESRKTPLQLESKVGSIEIVQKFEGDDNDDTNNTNFGPGYRCEICNWVAKDSSAYLTHLNSMEHNRMAGNSMKVKKAGVNKVRERLAALKRKANGVNNSNSSNSSNNKDDKKSKKDKEDDKGSGHKSDSDSDSGSGSGGLDPEMAAMMGFTDFGQKKKKKNEMK